MNQHSAHASADSELSIAGEFPPQQREQWRRQAERSLKGKPLDALAGTTPEGMIRQPLYCSDSDCSDSDQETAAGTDHSRPGQAPFTRGSQALGGWQVSRQISNPDPQSGTEQIRSGLACGVEAFRLRFATPCRLGLSLADPTTAGLPNDGLLVAGSQELSPLVAAFGSQPPALFLDAGGSTPAVAAAVIAALDHGRIRPNQLSGNLGCDPLGALATDGELPGSLDHSLEQMAALAAWTSEQAPQLRAVVLSSLPYHLAGANAIQELALTLATGVEYLRYLEPRIGLDSALAQIGMEVAIGRDLFIEIAKLRALRRLWSHLQQSCGGGGGGGCGVDTIPAPIHAVTSLRTISARDPWVNLLRGTTQSFAAIAGGADVVTTLPFDSALGQSSDLALRMALNTQTILRQESHLGRVADPAGGSWYVEQLTSELAERAWTLLQEIEAGGGMRSCLCNGRISELVGQTLSQRRQDLGRRRSPITGVSSYPLLDEQRPEPTAATVTYRDAAPASDAVQPALEQLAAADSAGSELVMAAISAYRAGATIAQVTATLTGDQPRQRITALPGEREAEPFEALRDAGDQYLASTGARPAVFLASIGAIPEHRARTSFAQGFFAAGGLQPMSSDGYDSVAAAASAFAAGGATVAAICSSDARYPELIPELVAALKAAGAATVLVAGRAGDHEQAWRQAGVDGYIYAGCDLIEVLSRLHELMGVSS